MAAEAIAERGGESYSGGRYCDASARKYLIDPEIFGRTAGERAVSLLGARPVPTTRAPVIFTPYTGWAFMVCLSQPLRGNFVVQERSYFADQLGQKVASDLVNIRDNALLERGSARRAFDGEGTPSRNLPLIEKGVLRNYLTDLASAAKLGVQPGGNTVRRSYDSDPEIRGSNYYMEAGTHDPKQIVKETKRGLVLDILSGWWVGMSPVSDTFSSAVMGFWIEDGEIAHPVKGISIGGSLREMLQSIDRVGTDLEFNGSTTTPTFRVGEMAISGT
jgi:PmbA protein